MIGKGSLTGTVFYTLHSAVKAHIGMDGSVSSKHILMNKEHGEMRKIIHIDMDMFYAAIEIRDKPELKNRPVVVGGKPNSRSVVATANYEARKYGIKSAMPCAEAYRRCPHCIFVAPNSKKYHAVSRQIQDIFFEYTSIVEPLSLDEAYLDVTQSSIQDPSVVAKEIKRMILQKTQLTASAGVAPNKFIAKIASDYNKPDGLCVVPPQRVLSFIYPLSVRKIPGVGAVTYKKMSYLQIETIKDLAQKSLGFLMDNFGKQGVHLHKISQGIDEREVIADRKRLSFGHENTFSNDIVNINEILERLHSYSEIVFKEISQRNLKAKTVTLKIKYYDFKIITRRETLSKSLMSSDEVYQIAKLLLEKTDAGSIPVRLVGISLSGFQTETDQMRFTFAEE